jgi:hypothetical protein
MERGMETAAARGASPDVLELMRGMEAEGGDERARLLRAADDGA